MHVNVKEEKKET